MERTKKRVLTRDQKIVLAVVVALTVIAWIYTAAFGDMDGMNSMSMDMSGGGDAQMEQAMANRALKAAYAPSMPPFSMFVPMWIVMCVGMMLPTALPMIFTFHTISSRRAAQGFTSTPTYMFIAGYVLLWALFGLVCWGVGEIVIALVGNLITDAVHSVIGGAVIFLLAGIYQLTPLKNACMRGCQNPVLFVMNQWRSGKGGALLMGMRHGFECIGCCWALMIVLFPLGMMNLFWMGLFTVLMFAEKNSKHGLLLSKVIGWVLIAAGVICIGMGLFVQSLR